MRNLLLFGIVLVAFSLFSCGKNYICTTKNGTEIKYNDKDWSEDHMVILEENCIADGGTWE